jgi:hypothetical protein
MPTTRKTGEPQRSKQPLSIDRLPGEMQDKIQEERAKYGKSFLRIEDESPKWKEWNDVDSKTAALFPGRRLPHSNLQRWWDLRKEQVKAQLMAETEQARAIAEAFANRDLEGAENGALNAIRDMAFSVMQSASLGDRARAMEALLEYGHLVAKFKRIELGKEKVRLESERLNLIAMKVKGLKSDVEKKKLTPKEMKDKLDEIYGLTA